MAAAETAVRMHGVVCTACGHRPHTEPCTNTIIVATGPSEGRKTPTEEVLCPCRKRGSVWL